jgi:hypothetical protein
MRRGEAAHGAAIEDVMEGSQDAKLRILQGRLESILSDHPVPSEEELPYLMNLAACLAEGYPGVDAATMLELVMVDVRRRLSTPPGD